MILAIGTKVQIRHTGDIGLIRSFLDDEMVEVYLPADEMNIPVSSKDLVPPGTKVVTEKKVIEKEEGRLNDPETQYTILKPLGIQLVFDPLPDQLNFEVYLLNDTQQEVLFSFRKLQNTSTQKSGHGKLKGMSAESIGTLLKTQLSDQTQYEIDCWPLLTQGSGQKLNKTIRIKPKAFFKNQRTVPIFHRKMHWYSVFESLLPKQEKIKEDLRTYTELNLPTAVSYNQAIYQQLDQHDIQELANFSPELDLHIENLQSGSVAGRNILRVQLEHFDAYVAKAVRLGVERVFVIHGIGKGKLKNAIATRLIQNPDIITFKNEFHPKYGWGATEIIINN